MPQITRRNAINWECVAPYANTAGGWREARAYRCNSPGVWEPTTATGILAPNATGYTISIPAAPSFAREFVATDCFLANVSTTDITATFTGNVTVTTIALYDYEFPIGHMTRTYNGGNNTTSYTGTDAATCEYLDERYGQGKTHIALSIMS